MYLILGTKKKDFEKLQQEKLDLEKAIKDKIKGNRIDYDGDKAHELFEFLLQYFEDYLEYSEKTRDLQKLKESVREGGYLKEITAELDALKKQEVEIKENIQASIKTVEIVKNVDVDKSEIDSLVHTIDNEIDICRSRISEKEKILLQIDGEIQENHDYSDELEKLMDEKNKYEDRIKLLHSRSSAVNCIKSALEEADRRREQKQLNKLIKNTIEKFNYLTGNQYITKIDERDIQDILNKKSFTKELNPAVIHAIVLSIKFSLTEFIVNAGLTLPLIIDDPFYSMDEERMRRFKDMVDDAAKSRQIIIFTHLKDSKNWGKFIEL